MKFTKPAMFGAPGCYGSALTYREDLVECRNCNFNNTCGVISAERLTRLRSVLGIEPVGPKKAKLPKRDATKARLDGALPKKTLAIIQLIERMNLRVAENLIRGTNPFNKPDFLRVMCHLLITFKTGVPRNVFKEVMQRKFNHSEAVANEYVTHGLRALQEIGVTVEENGIVRVKQ
jgi:hypothetical protein